MKVFIVTSVAFPFGMAATKRILNYAKALRDVSIPCEVLTFSRYQFDNDSISTGSYEEIPFKYFTNNKTKEGKTLSYKIESLFIRFKLLKYLRTYLTKGDVVLGYLKEIQMTERIIAITHHRRAKYVQELCELPAISIKNEKEAQKIRGRIEKILFSRFDGVLSISQALSDYATKHISCHCLIQKVPILVDYEEYRLDDLSELSNTPYIFHSGTLSENKDGFLGMLEAFGKAVSGGKICARFITTGSLEKAPNKNEIKYLIQKYDITDKVQFTGYLSDEQLKDYLSHATLVIINKSINTQNTYCFSTKLGEYMAAGKPIIITRVGEAMNWLTDGINAYFVEPNNVEDMAQNIVRVFTNKIERRTMGENARKQCKQAFHYGNYGKELVNFFNKLNN